MPIQGSRLFSLSLTASLLLSGCTVDAQLASQLLSTLQASTTSTKSSAKTTVKASATVTAEDAVIEAGPEQVLTRSLQVTCGGPGMRVASLDEAAEDSASGEDAEDSDTEETEQSQITVTAGADPDQSASSESGESASETAEETERSPDTTAESGSQTATESGVGQAAEAVLNESEEVAPVVLTAPDPAALPGQPAARARRVRLEAGLRTELKGLNRLSASERQRRFAAIREKYPEMRDTVPVQVHVRGRVDRPVAMTQVIFVQMPVQHGPMPAYGSDYRMPRAYPGGIRYPSGNYGTPHPAGPARQLTVSGRALLEGLGDLPCAPLPEADASTDSPDSND